MSDRESSLTEAMPAADRQAGRSPSFPAARRPARSSVSPWVALVLLATALLLPATGCSSASPPAAEAATTSTAADGSTDAGEKSTPAEDAIPVKVTPVVREPLSSLYSTSATLRAEKTATVTARTRGVIRRLAVEEGQTVDTGQPLVFLEDDEQKIELERARTIGDNRQREYDRISRLHSEGLISEEEYEASRREAAATAQDAAQAELALSRTIIRAPFGGTTITRHLDVGATVSDGTPVYDIADLSRLFADVNIPERHVLALQRGQTVRLTSDTAAATVGARIERIAPAVDPGTGTVKVTLVVSGQTRLRPGAFVRVDIVTDTHENALVIPRSALVAEGRRWHVFRLGDEGEVRQLEVSLGFEEGDRVEVLDILGKGGPLSPGERVVTVGAPALSDGSVVRLVPDTDESGDTSEAGEDVAGDDADGSVAGGNDVAAAEARVSS